LKGAGYDYDDPNVVQITHTAMEEEAWDRWSSNAKPSDSLAGALIGLIGGCFEGW
jgi:hypothetical protein